jgi:hypothetical protein
MRKTSTTKGFEHRKFWFGLVTKKAFKGRRIVNDSSGEAINQESRSKKGLIPEGDRHTGLSKKRKACFDDVAVLALNGAILLVGVWAGDPMCDSCILKIFMESAIFTSPIGLNNFNFLVKKQFNLFLELIKDGFNIGFGMKKINPCEFVKSSTKLT